MYYKMIDAQFWEKSLLYYTILEGGGASLDLATILKCASYERVLSFCAHGKWLLGGERERESISSMCLCVCGASDSPSTESACIYTSTTRVSQVWRRRVRGMRGIITSRGHRLTTTASCNCPIENIQKDQQAISPIMTGLLTFGIIQDNRIDLTVMHRCAATAERFKSTLRRKTAAHI